MAVSKPRRRTPEPLPASAKVGAYLYQLKLVPTDSLEDAVGEADTKAQTISIDEGLSIEARKATIVHELLHAIFDAYGIDNVVGELDEALVSMLELPLLQLIRDNPRLLAYLTD